MFLDESGDHNLTNLDSQGPIFCLAGVILNQEEYSRKLAQFNLIKVKYFGHEGLIFHSRDIRRMQDEFAILRDPAAKDLFYRELNEAMAGGYRVVCCSVNKPEYIRKYGPQDAMSPYHLSLGILLERVGFFLKTENVEKLRIVAESRGKREDQELEWNFHCILSGRNRQFHSKDFTERNITFEFATKTQNIIGLQIADLVAYPAACTHKDGVEHPSFKVIKPNFLYQSLRYNFKKLP